MRRIFQEETQGGSDATRISDGGFQQLGQDDARLRPFRQATKTWGQVLHYHILREPGVKKRGQVLQSSIHERENKNLIIGVRSRFFGQVP